MLKASNVLLNFRPSLFHSSFVPLLSSSSYNYHNRPANFITPCRSANSSPASSISATGGVNLIDHQKAQHDLIQIYSMLKKQTFYGRIIENHQTDRAEDAKSLKIEYIQIKRGRAINLHTEKTVYQYTLKKSTKAYLAKKCSLYLRDLRSLMQPDANSRQVATVIVQPNAVVVHIGPLQAIILKNELLCFNVYHPLIVSLVSHWPIKIEKTSIDRKYHELRCFEVILLELVHYLEFKYNQLSPDLCDVLEDLLSTQTSQQVQALLDASLRVDDFHEEVAQVSAGLSSLLNSDEDMAGLYLSDRSKVDHEEAELLLEALQHTVTEIDNRLKHFQNRMRLTEEYIRIHFDGQRNRLMRVTLIINIAAVAIAVAALGAGIFGMNLTSGWETDPKMFHEVVLILGLTSTSVFFFLFGYYRSTKHLSSSLTRLSRSVSELRVEEQKLFTHSARSKLLYNYATSNIDCQVAYEKFLKGNNQVDFLHSFTHDRFSRHTVDKYY